jgi:hypothetical protein
LASQQLLDRLTSPRARTRERGAEGSLLRFVGRAPLFGIASPRTTGFVNGRVLEADRFRSRIHSPRTIAAPPQRDSGQVRLVADWLSMFEVREHGQSVADGRWSGQRKMWATKPSNHLRGARVLPGNNHDPEVFMRVRTGGLVLALTLSGVPWTALPVQADSVHENEREERRQLRDELRRAAREAREAARFERRQMTSTGSEARRQAQMFRNEAMAMRHELRAQMRELRDQLRESMRAMRRDLRAQYRHRGWI